MDDKAFENKVNRDIDNAKEDVATLGEDGVTGLSRKFEQLTDETKERVTDAVKCIIRAKPIMNSGACRSPIPFHADR